jgi:succinyl-diaminopimelate desuccinylase
MMNTNDKLQLLADLVAIQSVDANETSVAKYLQHFFDQYGITSELVGNQPDRMNLVATLGNGQGPILAFSGHADTVHEGDLGTWSVDPFSLVERDGRLYGRGTTDMKAGLANFAIAMVELKARETELKGTLRFLLTMDEEKTQTGARYLTDHGYLKGVEAMVIGEPTGVPVTEIAAYFASGGAVIQPELLVELEQKLSSTSAPEQHFIFFAHKGFLVYDVIATGKAAHSSMPNLGVNALDHLVDYYQRERALYTTFTEVSPVMGQTQYNAGVFKGGSQPNSIPDYASMSVMTRVIPELPPEVIIERLEDLINTMNAEDSSRQLHLVVKAYDAAVVTNPDNRLVDLAQKQAHHYLKEAMDLPLITVGMGTDASQFVKANPSLSLVVIGPGNNTAHMPDEYVERDTYLTMSDFYRDLALDYLA